MMERQMEQKKKRTPRKLSQCKSEETKKCLGKYALSYEDNAPVFICDTCGHRDETWKKFYNEYLQLFNVKTNWDEGKHKVSCIIGYFCYKYKNKYNTDYVFIPKTPNPFSSKECKDAQSLLVAFGNDAKAVGKYINWLFKDIIRASTNIVSFGYIATPALVRRYMIQIEKDKNYTRASNLPEEYITWCNTNVPNLKTKYALLTMNDLGALFGYVKAYDTDIGQDSDEKKAITRAKELGLIKDNKLNVV